MSLSNRPRCKYCRSCTDDDKIYVCYICINLGERRNRNMGKGVPYIYPFCAKSLDCIGRCCPRCKTHVCRYHLITHMNTTSCLNHNNPYYVSDNESDTDCD